MAGSHLCIPRNETVISKTEFSQTAYICERFICFQDWSAFSAVGKYVDRSLGIYISLTDTCMNVEIGTETAQFSEKEYINGIFVAVEKI
jgi:hypothetical protein